MAAASACTHEDVFAAPCVRPRSAENIVEYFVIGGERESIVF